MAWRTAHMRKVPAVLLGVSATVILAGCAASPHSVSRSGRSAPVVSARSAAASASAPKSTPEAGAENLVASSAVEAALLTAYAADKGLPQDEVTGPLPGTLYYGIDSATGTYWAVAQFGLTPSASFDAEVDMQDGGNIGVFSRHGDQPWTVHLGGIPFPCPGELPADLMSVWGMTSPGGCHVLNAGSPAMSQATFADVLALPAGTYFGVVLNEWLQLDGYGGIDLEPETWQGASSPVSQSHLYYSLNIDASATTGYWTGPSRSASREILGSFDLAFAHSAFRARWCRS
jgi:hypothetical protein